MLERSYRYFRETIATVLEQLAATESLVVEAAAGVVRAAYRYRSGNAGFSDLMIVAATERSEAEFFLPSTRMPRGLKGLNCWRREKNKKLYNFGDLHE